MNMLRNNSILFRSKFAKIDIVVLRDISKLLKLENFRRPTYHSKIRNQIVLHELLIYGFLLDFRQSDKLH